MAAKMLELEPKKRTKEAAAAIFKEVLGHKSGYARGLSEMVIPESSRQAADPESSRQAADAQIAELTERAEMFEKAASDYKDQLDDLRANVMLLMERQAEYDKFMERYESVRQT